MIKKIFRIFKQKLLNGLSADINNLSASINVLLNDNMLLKQQYNELQAKLAENYEFLQKLTEKQQHSFYEIRGNLSSLELSCKKLNNIEHNLNQFLPAIEHSVRDFTYKNNIQFSDLKNKANTLLLRQQVNKQETLSCKKKFLFIIHNMYAWAALDLIYRNLLQRENAEVFVLAIQSNEGDSGIRKSYSSKTLEFLKNIGIEFHTINEWDVDSFIAYLHAIQPDYIIRQSGWDGDIPLLYSSLNLSNYKLIYIPYYSLDVVDDFSPDKLNLEYNQNFHLHCYRIYGVSHKFVERAKEVYLAGGGKFKFLGNTKLEFLSKNVQELNHFHNTGIANIIWAPHHSINGQWLAFGTFETNCMDFITLAKQYGDKIHIKLRPHPLLKNSMAEFNIELWNNFIEEWNKLPNTSFDEDWDYTKSFEWSDLMITDGISFIAEYPLTNKPIVYIEAEHHLKFNENGILSKNCCYVANNSDDIFELVESFFMQKLPCKIENVETLRNELNIEHAAERIVDDLMKLSDE